MDLTSPREKIARAIEHHCALNAAIDQWIADTPCGVEGRTDADGWFVVRFRVTKPPPLRLGALFGDFVGNLASALDHLAWQLVLESGGVPTASTYFPIVVEERRWQEASQRKLRGIRPEWLDIIRALQPFHDGVAAQFHPAAVLHAANNYNKHRVISPTIVSLRACEPTIELNRPAASGDSVAHDLSRLPMNGGDRVTDGAHITAVRAVSSNGELAIVRLTGELPCDVGIDFDFGVLGKGTYPDFLAWVTRAVDSFDAEA